MMDDEKAVQQYKNIKLLDMDTKGASIRHLL